MRKLVNTMVDVVAKRFNKHPTEQNSIDLLTELKTYGFFHIGCLIGAKLSDMFRSNLLIQELLADMSMNTDSFQDAYDLYASILSNTSVIPHTTANLLLRKQSIILEKFKENYIFYPQNVVKKIVDYGLRPIEVVTFTITTCKRFDLFQKTMNSFLNCCLDYKKIDKWICIDDNSSEEDREQMKLLYPFFTFVFKNQDNSGHSASMNIIQDLVTTPYLFHMEDDWMFVAKKNYITDCLDGLGCGDNVKQCLINRNYAEVLEDYKILGGEPIVSKSGNRLYAHEFGISQEKFNEKYGSGFSCFYWPHFSFRPSMIKTEIFKDIGKYNLDGHFEMEYAYRYIAKGYISVFFESITSIHIGRLTSERDTDKKNAYDLNNVSQFVEKETPKESKPENLIVDMTPKATIKNTKFLIVNLKRRDDRYRQFVARFCNCGRPNIFPKRYDAIDGKYLKNSVQLQRIFEPNDYNMKSGAVGCAMSHIDLCIQLINDMEAEFYCIMEDDIEFANDFEEKIKALFKNTLNWDMIYLGHHSKGSQKFNPNDKYPIARKYNTSQSIAMSLGGTGGYVISKEGARKLLEFIDTVGMGNCIDTMQQRAADIMNVYYCYPHLIYSECYRGDNKQVDTDIQFDYTSLQLTIDETLFLIPNIRQEDFAPSNTTDLPFYIKFSTIEQLQVIKDRLGDVYSYVLSSPGHSEKSIVITSENTRNRLKKHGEFTVQECLQYQD
jgi:GR25 family glycosyltransferase involved in LPS biosynthesis